MSSDARSTKNTGRGEVENIEGRDREDREKKSQRRDSGRRDREGETH